jgi:hypothetical protein
MGSLLNKTLGNSVVEPVWSLEGGIHLLSCEGKHLLLAWPSIPEVLYLLQMRPRTESGCSTKHRMKHKTILHHLIISSLFSHTQYNI